MVCRAGGAVEALLVTVTAAALLGLAEAAPRRQEGDCQRVPMQGFFLWDDGWGPDCASQLVSAEGDDAAAASIENPHLLPSETAAHCDEDQIIIQLRRLQAITPESIVLLATEQDLDELCSQVRDSLDAMAKVAAACAALGDDDRDIYQALLRGVATLHADLCAPAQPGGLRANFLKHSACLRNLSKELQGCAGPQSWTDSTDDRAVCATYGRIATCYHSTTAVACGSDAGELMHRLVVSVASSVLGKLRCKDMEQLKQPEQSKQLQQINVMPGPEHGSFSSHHISFNIAIFTFCSTTFALCG